MFIFRWPNDNRNTLYVYYEACYLVLQTNLGHTSDKTDLHINILMQF